MSAPVVDPEITEPLVVEPSAGRAPRAVLAVWGVLLVAFLAAMWSRRWISDDGFINFRIVDNIVHGHGPVFNAGERVEAGTSQLWLLVLLAARLTFGWFIDLEWLAVLAGLACSAGAVAVAVAGQWRSWRAPVVPFALLAWVALPAVWDFSSSGLEGPLLWLWLAACFALLGVRATADPRPVDTPWWLPVLIGLGPLIRPDAALYSAAFAVALLVLSTRTWRSAARALALALALPVLYEVFRAGFFGVLLPNTALAKEAGSAQWGEGGRYLADFVRVEALWLPLGLLVVVAVVLALSRAVARRTALLWGVTVAVGLLHAVWVVRVGGDFMHARLLLPDWFLVVLPLGALPVATVRRPVVAAATVAMVCWGAWAVVAVRPAFQSRIAPGVVDERTNYAVASGDEHPVTLADHAGNVWTRWGDDARRRAARGEDVLLFPMWHQPTRVAPARAGTYLVWPNIGMMGYAAGEDVYVVDAYGLADPIAARLEAGPGRAGHAKVMGLPWIEARFSPRDADLSPDAALAARALSCPPVQELLDAVRGPLTPKRFVANLLRSPSLTRLRVPEEPARAVRELC